MAAESSEKIQRALRKQIRLKREEFKQGEKVLVLRDGEWKGPGWIIGKDNVVVIVRFGGTYVRIHQSRFLRAFKSKALYDNKTTDNIESDDSKDDGRNTDAAGNGTNNNDDFPSDVHQDGEIKDEDFGASAIIEQCGSASGRQVNTNVITVQKDQIVLFQFAENGKEHEAKILGQAGKASIKTKTGTILNI